MQDLSRSGRKAKTPNYNYAFIRTRLATKKCRAGAFCRMSARQVTLDRMSDKLLIATNNAGKLAEMRELLAGVRLSIVSLDEFPDVAEVEETGITFKENAAIKAAAYARQAKMVTLADDSGLEVEALGDRPGVYSARYGGANLTYAEKMGKLLGELADTGDVMRRARFVCSLAVADELGMILFECEGICAGRIALEPRGSGGFGYDPIFIPDGFEKTFGELPQAIKSQISHRARVFMQIIPFLRRFSRV